MPAEESIETRKKRRKNSGRERKGERKAERKGGGTANVKQTENFSERD